jgi:hypothetical protein
MKAKDLKLMLPATIEHKIVTLRGLRVMLDLDLAELYGVETKEINRAVARNRERFPADFAFRLNQSEFQDLRCQIGTSSWGGRRYPPVVFTEQGVAMLSSVLHSERAVRVNVQIMRVFVRLRQWVGSHDQLARKIGELEKKIQTQDGEIKLIFAAINTMLHPVTRKKRQIGFAPKGSEGK